MPILPDIQEAQCFTLILLVVLALLITYGVALLLKITGQIATLEERTRDLAMLLARKIDRINRPPDNE